jgi:outer membrane immunogenic protein
MKNFLLGGVALMVLAGAANAADLPAAAPPVYKAAPVAVPYSWKGFYIGLQGGYGWGGDAINLTPDANYAPAFAAGVFPRTLAANPSGALGGIQYGTNWQFGHVVLGTASDFSFSDIKSSQTVITQGGTTTNLGTQKLSWFSTTRARAGYTITDSLLLYGTGGLADGRASATSSFTVAGACGGGGNCPAGSAAKTMWGWAAGGGMEYAMGHWSMNLEYLHYDLGHLNYNMTDPTLPGAFIAASTKVSGDIVRAGVNYRFDWTPWELLFGHGS